MESARPIQDETSAADQGAVVVAPGSLPLRKNTVTADVLARLLAHERLTGLDAVTDSSTTRLAAVVEYLAKRYNWTISRHDKVTGCNDGRVTTVSVYFRLSGVIELAAAAGSAGWCVEVRAARLKLRANAAAAKRIAERANKNRQRFQRIQQAGQCGLFDGDGVPASMMPAHIRWLAELQALAARFSGGLTAALAALSLAELWGFYALLRAWAEQGA